MFPLEITHHAKNWEDLTLNEKKTINSCQHPEDREVLALPGAKKVFSRNHDKNASTRNYELLETNK